MFAHLNCCFAPTAAVNGPRFVTGSYGPSPVNGDTATILDPQRLFRGKLMSLE
jgi:hypothetical protein